jgi:hypothetical protein
MDGKDRIVFVEATGKQVPQFKALYFLFERIQIIPDLFEEEPAFLFFKYPYRFLDIR